MLAGLLAAGRAAANALMTDTCTVTRISTATTNATTGAVTAASAVVYTGRCRVQSYQPFEETPEVGERTATVQRYGAHFPMGAFVPTVGDVVTITASTHTPAMVTKKYRIVAPFTKTHATAQRCYVEEVVA